MSEIIFWRHAEAHEAEENQDDWERKLTVKGQRHAERIGHWLDRNLPQQCKVFMSPTKRTQQTAHWLARKNKILPELAPDSRPETVLAAVGWGTQHEPIVLIGHQPWIGECVHWLLFDTIAPLSVRKGAVWWLQTRSRKSDDVPDIIVRTVASPDLL